MTATGRKLKFKITNVFLRNWRSRRRIVINRGGTRSGKTYSICQLFVNWLIFGWIRQNEYIPTGKATIVRKHKTTVKSTVQSDFDEILELMGLTALVAINKTERTYSFNGRTVQFIGADDAQKLRGYKSNILYCNEANELGFKSEFFQLLMRTSGPVFLDLNPSDPYVWINTEIEQRRATARGDVDIIVSTYKDNPTLPIEMVSEIEYLSETDAQLWEVYGLGKYGKVEGLIIPEVEIISEIPPEARKIAAGLDFGFTNSYTALENCGFIPPNNLFVDEKLYSTGLTDSLLIQRLESLKYPKNSEIIADSAQAATIAELRYSGYNAHPVRKIKAPKNELGKYGISLLRSMKWHITGDSAGMLKEQKLYKFKQNAAGDWLNEPIDVFNHAFDAVRYYAITKLSARMPGHRRQTKIIH